MRVCKKIPLEKIQAEIIVARNLAWTHSPNAKPSQRNEIRFYYCSECKAYHTTSKPRRPPREKEKEE